MTEDPAKQAWQASVEIAGAPPIDEVRNGADKFYRYVKWRNRVEYAACVLVVIGFTSMIFTQPHLLQKVGAALIVLATFYVGWQLHRRASAEAPEEAGTMPILVFARTQLVRQRDALKAILRWYILPFVPGLALMTAGTMQDRVAEGEEGIIRSIIGVTIMVLILALVWWVNQVAARKLQRHIDEIDALTGVDG